MRRKIAILGSTGSIGKNALKVALRHKDKIEIVALAVRENIDLLEEQIAKHQPKAVAVYDVKKAALLRKRVNIPVFEGMDGLREIATFPEVETVLAAIVGSVGLLPTVDAIKARKTIALANKEVLVSAGAYIMPLAKERGVTILPVDSEHNAVFQCLEGENRKAVSRVILTASGGPFRGYTKERLGKITPSEALNHPNFAMGSKITVDSSTLMNKGLEVIEAHFLFGTPADKIEVVVHPEQKIHGMVEFVDGSILAEMCEPDMLVPIAYAMTYPERVKGLLPPYDFIKNGSLTFDAPDRETFRCLDLAYESLRLGGTMSCYMNGANEILVERFLKGKISWLDIAEKLETLIGRYKNTADVSLDSILAVDALSKKEASEI